MIEPSTTMTPSLSTGVDGTAENSSNGTNSVEDGLGGVSSEKLRFITRRMSRALLRHPEQEELYTSERAMYMALFKLFTDWSARERRAAALGLEARQVRCIVKFGEESIQRAALPGTVLGRAGTRAQLVEASPLIALDTLKLELKGLPVPVTLAAIAEVLELARVLDRAQGLSTPFGAVNLVHFIALSTTLLCPAPDMKALLLFVAEETQSCLLCATVFYEWALIDKLNAPMLMSLSEQLEEFHRKRKLGGETTLEVVTALLNSSFESLGCAPVDPAVCDLLPEWTSQRMNTSTSLGTMPMISCPDAVANDAHLDDDAARDSACDGSGEIVQRVDEEEVGISSPHSESKSDWGVEDTIDKEFWRRLCS